MGCQNSFSKANTATVVTFFFVLVANFCSWLAFTTTSWHVTSEATGGTNGDLHLGLWRECRDKLISACNSLDGFSDSTFAAIQAFASLAHLSVNLGHAMVLCYIFLDSFRKHQGLGFVSGLTLLMAGLFWTMTVVVFALGYDETGADLGYSFGFAVASAVFAVVAGFVMLFATRTDRAESTPVKHRPLVG